MQDIVNKALESAKSLTHTVGESLDKGKDQLRQHAPEFGEAAKHQLANAADGARAAIHSAAKAVSEATAPKPPAPPRA